MIQTYTIEEIEIRAEKKRIKNKYIRVSKPDGVVSITVPMGISEKEILEFARGHLDWIRSHRKEAMAHQTEDLSVKRYEDGDPVFLWGIGHPLKVVEFWGRPGMALMEDGTALMRVKKGFSVEQKEALVEEWYRRELQHAVVSMMKHCCEITGKQPEEWHIKKMKTRWGTCNVVSKRIWLSLWLAQHSPECLEYVMIHELTHLYVRDHGTRFKAYMDRFYPEWRVVRERLNAPLT